MFLAELNSASVISLHTVHSHAHLLPTTSCSFLLRLPVTLWQPAPLIALPPRLGGCSTPCVLSLKINVSVSPQQQENNPHRKGESEAEGTT
ncbi:hypothetical protein E2C01_022502 [Portunus trituberculatus]|uniref:Uncharacterized protein n=1 Tax=Portunus trituberculatus TaxID=210409 RepID=A0A5B7E7F9_PORTR|nr:hypothetical protein [Portunus trituberculatus]